MKLKSWFKSLSLAQRVWLFSTIIAMNLIVVAGFFPKNYQKKYKPADFNSSMSIKDIAFKLGIKPRILAEKLDLPEHSRKGWPLSSLGIDDEKLHKTLTYILSHSYNELKYYIFAALFLGAIIFLVRLGRPDESDIKERGVWYPRSVYIAFLTFSLVCTGFILGKSPNPMESVVKLLKSINGYFPDPYVKLASFIFFILLAVIGNKVICGWICPFGSFQELIYSLPVFKKIKRKKLPFVFTNSIRCLLFIIMAFVLFGHAGGKKGTMLYHYVNPFNLHFKKTIFLIPIVIILGLSFLVYRPFCQLICPFGFISWFAEHLSFFRVRINKNKCIDCGACVKVCPTNAVKNMIKDKKIHADCFSCARCLNVCPVDAIKYTHKKQQ